MKLPVQVPDPTPDFLQASDSCEHATFTADGRIVTTGMALRIWNPDTRSLEVEYGYERDAECRAVAAARNEDLLAVGRFLSKNVDLVRTHDGTVVHRLLHEQWTRSIALSEDGGLVVTGGGMQYQGTPDSLVRVWDTRTGELRWGLKGLRASVAAVAISADGFVAAAAKTTARAWSLFEHGEPKKHPGAAIKLPQKAEVTQLEFTPNGSLMVAAGCLVRRIDPYTGEVLWERSWERVQIVACAAMTVTPAGVLASVVDTIVLLDVETGAVRWEVKGPPGLRCLAASPDGTTFVAVGLHAQVQLRHLTDGALIQ